MYCTESRLAQMTECDCREVLYRRKLYCTGISISLMNSTLVRWSSASFMSAARPVLYDDTPSLFECRPRAARDVSA